MSKIVQIIPADGWYAEYEYDSHDESQPLICWALDEDGFIRPMTADSFGAVTDTNADNLLSIYRTVNEDEVFA